MKINTHTGSGHTLTVFSFLYMAIAVSGILNAQTSPVMRADRAKTVMNPAVVGQDSLRKPYNFRVVTDRIVAADVIKDGTTKPVEPPKPSPEQLQREGPNNLGTIEWKNMIGGEYTFPGSYPLVNIYYQIYGDANAKSGYYYYFPNSYNLKWSTVSGYALYIKFLSSTSGGRGEATVTAELTPNISNTDLAMAGELLRRGLQGRPDMQYVELLSLVSAPLAGPPKVSINQISSFGIDPKDISVTRPSNLAEPITISWKMSNVENLMTALFENVGLSGNLFLQPLGANMPEISIPFNIKLNDQNTFGKFELEPGQWRTNAWINSTPYPVTLKNMHIMKAMNGGAQALNVYTWQAGNIEVPPGAQVTLNASSVPGWIDSNPTIKRLWLDYEVNGCNYCDDIVQNTLVGGAKGTRSRTLTFDVFDPIAYTGARMIKVKVRSVQADPNTRSKMDLPTLTIHTDGVTLQGGTIYVPEGSDPEFEYYLQVIMPDGTIYESDYWEISKDPDTNILGQALIKRMVKSFKP